MVDGADAEPRREIVWTRAIDQAALSARWRKLGLYYGLPVIAVLAVGLIVGGAGAFLGLAILLGLFGLMLVALVFFKNLNAKANATIERAGDELILGNRRVDLTRLESWATKSDKEDWGVREAAVSGNPMAGNAITATVIFRMTSESGPEVVRFVWAEMPPDHLDQLRATLEPHIDAPFVPSDQTGR